MVERRSKCVIGTYVHVNLDDATTKSIVEFLEKEKIPNPVPADKLHVTVIYSRNKIFDLEPSTEIYNAISTGLDCWTSRPNRERKTPTNGLVLKLTAPKLNMRHEHIMKNSDATYDFDSYIPHITLSYDIGDFDYTSLNLTLDDIVLGDEEINDLNLDWTSN